MTSKISTSVLGDLIVHKKGFAFKSSDYQPNGTPVIRVTNFTSNSIDPGDLKFVSSEIAKANSSVTLKENDIVVATVGSWPNNPSSVVGRTISVPSWANGALMNQNAVIIRANSSNPFDQSFIYYQMKSVAFSNHLISKAQGSANQASITLEAIFSYPIIWPESPGQRKKVAEILRSLDDRIILLRATNSTLEAIAQAIFKSWFIDFDPVRANQSGIKPDGVDEAIAELFPDDFEQSELGELPKGWAFSSVGESFELTMGQSPPGDTYCEDQNEIPFYQGRTDFGFRFPTKRIYCTSPTRIAEIGDTIVSVRAPVGDVNMAIERCCIGRGVASVRHPNNYRSFTFYAIAGLKKYFRNFDSEGTVFGSINKNDFQALPIILPDMIVLAAYDEISRPIDSRIIENEHQIRVLSNLRDTLIPRLISGQLRLPDEQDHIEAGLV